MSFLWEENRKKRAGVTPIRGNGFDTYFTVFLEVPFDSYFTVLSHFLVSWGLFSLVKYGVFELVQNFRCTVPS